AAEALAPATGRPAERTAKRLARLQSALGEHHDAVVARAALRELGMAAHLAHENAFTYGLLSGLEHGRAQAAEPELERAWARASSKRGSGWLR
ncbi:CHAD domain-containing protein, partial [Agrococcus sp. HG114]|uniref:CHAD domain-containing protein n=1 Tax=Agrococcus sp. HG114 TaxID=2969757 RepID=UPI00215B32F7